MLSSCVYMCLWVAAGCRLCKSWARASGQLEGQTRKQMDPFGLNPSHAILSSWPSSSNQQAPLQYKCRGVCVRVFMSKSGGWVVHGILLLVPSRKTDKRESKKLTYKLCVCWTVLTYGSCLHVGTPCLLCPFVSFFLLWYALLSAL